MSHYRGNSVRVRERTFDMGRVGYIVKCDEPLCEWYTTVALSEDHAKEIEVNHYRVAHPRLHAEKVWDSYGPGATL